MKAFTPLILAALLPLSAQAGDHVYTATHPAWQAECGSCHIAYPPRLLLAESWRAMMAGLDKHFGTDASLDAKTAADITAFLVKNAGLKPGKYVLPDGGMAQRISETRWFRKEHDKDLSPSVWKHPKVKSAANCGACHQGADKGDYSESGIRIPC